MRTTAKEIADLRRQLAEKDARFEKADKRCAELWDCTQDLEKQLEKARELLNAAKCPNCDGIGEYYRRDAKFLPDNGEVAQCQWCEERKAALAPEQPSKESEK